MYRSFGIVLWEIFSEGATPYCDKSNAEAIDAIQKGYRLPSPKDCPSEIYEVMLKCWHEGKKMCGQKFF
jgi:hypothetical protein